jgi:hypothetical protein
VVLVYRKIVAVALVSALLISAGGCSGVWRKKFIKTKNTEEIDSPVLQPKEYIKEFTNQQLYANHFAFWRNAEEELINCLPGDSQKRIDTYAAYSINELAKLKNLLVEKKAQQIEPFIRELRDVIGNIKQPNYLSSNRNKVSDCLNKHYRNVSRNFSYYNMKKYILPEPKDAPSE